MKILAIIGSVRKVNTYSIVKKIESKMIELGNNNLEFEYLFLKDINLEICRGCGLCQIKGENYCPIKDERKNIENMMFNSDGVIFASPVYVEQVSALMKNFIDRFAYFCHRPAFFDKYALALSTAGGGGLDKTNDYIERFAGLWGFNVISKLGVAIPMAPPVPEMLKKKAEKDIGITTRRFHNALVSKKRNSPGLKRIIEFRILKVIFCRKPYPADYEYFKNKKNYYYNIKLNPLKNMIGWIIENLVRILFKIPLEKN